MEKLPDNFPRPYPPLDSRKNGKKTCIVYLANDTRQGEPVMICSYIIEGDKIIGIDGDYPLKEWIFKTIAINIQYMKHLKKKRISINFSLECMSVGTAIIKLFNGETPKTYTEIEIAHWWKGITGYSGVVNIFSGYEPMLIEKKNGLYLSVYQFGKNIEELLLR